MSDSLQRAYAFLVDALRTPRKKDALAEAVERAVREVRDAIVATGADPDAQWIRRATFPEVMPEVLHVTLEPDSDGTVFAMAHEDGIIRLDNGQRVGVYRLESTGIVEVTVALRESVAKVAT